MNFRKKIDKDIRVGKSAPQWMTTYSDLMTQVLIFFVMLFALSSAMNELQLLKLKKELEKYIKENSLEKTIALVINEKGLVVSLREKIMFDSGKAKLYPRAKQILSKISEYLVKIPNKVRIEGHTDNVPISTLQFPSNWELSTTRATNVTRYLIEMKKFPSERISAGGYGEYYPVVKNDTPKHRALNRRVDVVVRRLGVKRVKHRPLLK